MGQDKLNKVLELFYEYPTLMFTVREITKRTRVPSSTVQRYLEVFKKQGFVDKENRMVITPYFKFRKTFFLIDRMFKTGLIDYLKEEFVPSTIVVFGSIRKGEYEKESDIDLFIETTKKAEIDLSSFEKRLGHKIQLFIRRNINELPDNLFNNVVNGIKLYGSFRVKDGKKD